MLPSAESATSLPNSVLVPSARLAPVVGAVSLACSVHAVPARVNTYAAPVPLASSKAPVIAVVPSAEMNAAPPSSPPPISALGPLVGAVSLAYSRKVSPTAACAVVTHAAHTTAMRRDDSNQMTTPRN